MNDICLIVPVFNDWSAATKLCQLIHQAIAPMTHYEIILVNDGSTEPLKKESHHFSEKVTVLNLRRNVGHQKAIASGCVYAYSKVESKFYAVLDGDGEDNPAYIKSMLHKADDNNIVVAQRSKRSEGKVFVLSYFIYKKIFKYFIGVPIDFGNFSLFSRQVLKRIVHMQEIQTSFPGTLILSKCPIVKLPTERSKRLDGQSKMNFISLIDHGLKMMTVFKQKAFIRIFIFLNFITIVTTGIFAVLFLNKIFNFFQPSPSWVIELLGVTFTVLFTLMFVCISSLFIVNSIDNDLNSPFEKLQKFYDETS